MQLNDRDIPLHIFGPKGIEDLIKKLLSLGYFKPNYKIISTEIDEGIKLDFDEYFINILRVKHGIPALAFSFEEKMRPGKFNKAKALKVLRARLYDQVRTETEEQVAKARRSQILSGDRSEKI